jgi:hypothetical protein
LVNQVTGNKSVQQKIRSVPNLLKSLMHYLLLIQNNSVNCRFLSAACVFVIGLPPAPMLFPAS